MIPEVVVCSRLDQQDTFNDDTNWRHQSRERVVLTVVRMQEEEAPTMNWQDAWRTGVSGSEISEAKPRIPSHMETRHRRGSILPGCSSVSTTVLSQRRASRLTNSFTQQQSGSGRQDEDGRSEMKEEQVATRRAPPIPPPTPVCPSFPLFLSHTLSLCVSELSFFWTELCCPFQSYFDRLGLALVFSLTAFLFVSRRICRLFA